MAGVGFLMDGTGLGRRKYAKAQDGSESPLRGNNVASVHVSLSKTSHMIMSNSLERGSITESYIPKRPSQNVSKIYKNI